MVWPEFDGGWMSILERRPVRLAIAAALLLAVVAVPVRLLTHHRDATVVRLAAGTGVGHGLRLKQAISPPPVGEVAATRLHAGGVERPQEPRSTHKLRQDREPGGQESMAFAPIEFKPITIAPISIRALN